MKRINIFYFAFLVLFLNSCQDNVDSKKEMKKEEPNVFFKNINEGDTLKSPFLVQMGVNGMNVEPAGYLNKGYGHHHIIINCTHIEDRNFIPLDEKHIHYGQGETEANLDLQPGNYCLTLQFADGYHQSYGKDYSNTINVVVE